MRSSSGAASFLHQQDKAVEADPLPPRPWNPVGYKDARCGPTVQPDVVDIPGQRVPRGDGFFSFGHNVLQQSNLIGSQNEKGRI